MDANTMEGLERLTWRSEMGWGGVVTGGHTAISLQHFSMNKQMLLFWNGLDEGVGTRIGWT